jgi:large subunit ribosomal protein L6
MSGKISDGKEEKPLSRIGRKPIPIPDGVEVSVEYGQVTVKGPNGTVVQAVHPEVVVKLENGQVLVERTSSRKFHRALHGLTRSLISNAVTGATKGFEKTLELMGVGYRVQQSGEGIVLNVGYSHTVEVQPLAGVTLTVEGNNRVHVRGTDKQKVGEVAARIRKVRRPNPYKEKGIKYAGEVIRLKPGKSAARKN